MSDITGAGQAISGGLQAAGAVQSANVQAAAVNHATDTAQQRYQQTRDDLSNYNVTGQNAITDGLDKLGDYAKNGSNFVGQMEASIPGQTLQDAANYLPTVQNNSVLPGNMTQAELEQTPGYQFTRDQGLRATQASAAARGLGVSGAALQGAATYATGLANNTYKDQFAIQQQQFADQLGKDQQNYTQANTNFNNILNLRQGQFNQGQTQFGDWNTTGTFSQNTLQNRLNYLSSLGSLGENAAAQTGSVGASLSASGGNQAISGANAIGNTVANGANGLTSSINSYLNNNQQNGLLDKYFGGSGGSSSGASGNLYSGGGNANSIYNNYNSESGY